MHGQMNASIDTWRMTKVRNQLAFKLKKIQLRFKEQLFTETTSDILHLRKQCILIAQDFLIALQIELLVL